MEGRESPPSELWSEIVPNDRHLADAIDAFNSGATFGAIGEMLAERGLAPHLVPDVVTSLATGRAADLLIRGHAVRTVRQTLVQRGLSDSDAKYIVEQATANLSRKLHSFGIGKWKSRALGIGATCFMIGFGLFFAAKIGSPVVPDAIWAIMLGAGAILSAFGGLALVIDQV